MRLNEYLRAKAFDVVDRLRKDSLKRYINELEEFELMEHPYQSVEEKLKKFLNKAHTTTSFYRNYTGLFDLTRYPIINKNDLSVSEEYIRSKEFSNKQLVKVHTSGSYGTPFTFYLTKQKRRRQLSEVLYYGAKAGYQIGIRHGYFRTYLAKSNLTLWLQNETFFCSKVLNDEFLENGRLCLLTKKIKVLIGFPSAIAMLAEYCLQKGDIAAKFCVTGVITCSEGLTSLQRSLISSAFGCEVHNRYSTEELGVLACEYVDKGGFQLNTCNYIIEVLQLDADISVKSGETGRVVVTDLHADAFPLIRYETGDLAVLGEVFEEHTGWAKSLTALSGRTAQILNATNGEKLYPLYLDGIMEKYNVFSQYQLIQEDKTVFTFNLVPNAKFETLTLPTDDLVTKLKQWLGKEAQINFNLMDDIEALPSGKRPFIINRLIK